MELPQSPVSSLVSNQIDTFVILCALYQDNFIIRIKIQSSLSLRLIRFIFCQKELPFVERDIT